MEQKVINNLVNTLYYLYFENRELVYHFERVWTKDGMRYSNEEYANMFCGTNNPVFQVDLETYYFLHENEVIEQTSGNKHDYVYTLTEKSKKHFQGLLKKNVKNVANLLEIIVK
jgi:hypothetical protein